jgi:succinate dehydrogenase/fumarate reductase flavoprotein subunit
MIQRLQSIMADDVGPLRTGDRLDRARRGIKDLQNALGDHPFGEDARFNPVRLDWFDLRNMLLVASTVVDSAISRTESRGAHQREDHPGMLPKWQVNQIVRLAGGHLDISSAPAAPEIAAQ